MKKSILNDNQEHTDIFTARTPTISVMFTAFAFIIWAGCIIAMVVFATKHALNLFAWIYIVSAFVSGCLCEAIAFAVKCLYNIMRNTNITNMFILDWYNSNKKENEEPSA